MNDKESELIDKLLRAQYTVAELYRKNLLLEDQKQDLSHRLNALTNDQLGPSAGISSIGNEHRVELHIQETLRLRRKNPTWFLKSYFLSLKIRQLRLFDFHWYLDQYPDLKESGVRPFLHFLTYGLFEGRDPSPKFNTKFYLAECLHMLKPGEPALFHYLTHGREAGIPASLTASHSGTRFTAVRLSNFESQIASMQTEIRALNCNSIEHIKNQQENFKSFQLHVASSLEKFTDQYKNLASQVTKSVKSITESSHNDAHQLGNLIGIHNYLIHGEQPLSFRGWPISPDLGLVLMDLLFRNKYDLIIEFGSGSSTVLLAKIVSRLRQSDSQESLGDSPKIVSFEHLSKFHKKTMSMVEKSGLAHFAQVYLTPLVVYEEREGAAFSFYDCQKILSEIAENSNLGENSRILVLVDGPPEATNVMARLPALDTLRRYFPLSCIELILDDYRRADEQAIVENWKSDCSKDRIPFSYEEIKTEKGCAIFRYRG